ncbi:MAG: hypothetical protein KBE73_02270 [Fusobacteriaceae bacterium]|jgi:rhodanese-related sulfurtransferase|nr:hypothetical protein [Fusobacteriaceae bacterium]MBP6322412.1 hypothetical protein [Fusobacteriaceae bacterium]MBP9509947.1 hypothetical protein [Fusobacteriaceae bacterium]
MEISTVTVEELLNNKNLYIIIDVRVKDQYLEKHIHGAINIPLAEIKEHINELPKDKKIVTYCNGGTSGGIASLILRESGLEAYNLEGGFKNYQLKNK